MLGESMTETGKLTQVLSDRQGLQDRMGGGGRDKGGDQEEGKGRRRNGYNGQEEEGPRFGV